jgi:hypothetical protein
MPKAQGAFIALPEYEALARTHGEILPLPTDPSRLLGWVHAKMIGGKTLSGGLIQELCKRRYNL